MNPGNRSGGEDWDQGGQNQFDKEVVAKRQKTKTSDTKPRQPEREQVSTLNRGRISINSIQQYTYVFK